MKDKKFIVLIFSCVLYGVIFADWDGRDVIKTQIRMDNGMYYIWMKVNKRDWYSLKGKGLINIEYAELVLNSIEAELYREFRGKKIVCKRESVE